MPLILACNEKPKHVSGGHAEPEALVHVEVGSARLSLPNRRIAGLLARLRKHVGRHIQTTHVHPCLGERDSDTPGSATDVQRCVADLPG